MVTFQDAECLLIIAGRQSIGGITECWDIQAKCHWEGMASRCEGLAFSSYIWTAIYLSVLTKLPDLN